MADQHLMHTLTDFQLSQLGKTVTENLESAIDRLVELVEETRDDQRNQQINFVRAKNELIDHNRRIGLQAIQIEHLQDDVLYGNRGKGVLRLKKPFKTKTIRKEKRASRRLPKQLE